MPPSVWLGATFVIDLRHPTGRTFTSDWPVNSCLMAVYENILVMLWTEYNDSTLSVEKCRQPL